ncbi:MAG TPA: hypothetical protein VN790_08375 [Steroidobacteraceae bacterium]|nr:hypothetical protein [Steroidobacteraceae bacterium]
MLKDRAWIERHIPHQGTMCLLHGVLDWNANRVRCLSRAHHSPDNPLRARGRLGAVCGIEFAAQAMAVHGALLAPEPGLERRVGYLASVRSVELLASRLDDIEDDLIAAADRLGGDDATVLYRFTLSAGTRPLVTGRATIVINPAALARNFTPASD